MHKTGFFKAILMFLSKSVLVIQLCPIHVFCLLFQLDLLLFRHLQPMLDARLPLDADAAS